MKVLQVIDRLNIGGAEKVFLDLTKLLLDENLHVDVMLISGKGALYASIDKRSNIYFLNRLFKFSIRKLLVCSRICADYDIVHVHMRFTYSYIKLAQLISRKKFKIVFHDHFGDIEVDNSVPLFFSNILRPEIYIGVSESLINWARQKLGISYNNSILLRNTSLPNIESLVIENGRDWIMVSNIRKTKNIELAIYLANKLKKHLCIYGNSFDKNYTHQILKLIGESKYVSIINGEMNIQKYFSNYRMAIHTSISESGPVVLIEYLANGLPFIAYNTGEVAKVIKKELPECFVDSLEHEEWIQKINNLELNKPDPDKLKFLYERYFGPKQYSNTCIGIYQKVLHS